VSAEILRPYVRDDVYQIVLHHQDFTTRHLAPVFGGDPDRRDRWRQAPWFRLAERFADEWDQLSFDPQYPTEPLQHFERHVRQIFDTSIPDQPAAPS
jgi:predicted HD phosphohydrolase